MESKSLKYGIAVTFVNPAYTSQAGKVKYMGRYGMSIHEAASLTIARRGMGFSERLPDRFRKCLDPKPVKKPPVKTARAAKAVKTNITDDPASGTDSGAAPAKKSLPLIQRRRIFHWKAAYPETCRLRPVDIYRHRHSEKKNNIQTV